MKNNMHIYKPKPSYFIIFIYKSEILNYNKKDQIYDTTNVKRLQKKLKCNVLVEQSQAPKEFPTELKTYFNSIHKKRQHQS